MNVLEHIHRLMANVRFFFLWRYRPNRT